MSNGKVRLQVDVDVSVRHRLKWVAAKHCMDMGEMVEEALRRYLEYIEPQTQETHTIAPGAVEVRA